MKKLNHMDVFPLLFVLLIVGIIVLSLILGTNQDKINEKESKMFLKSFYKEYYMFNADVDNAKRCLQKQKPDSALIYTFNAQQHYNKMDSLNRNYHKDH